MRLRLRTNLRKSSDNVLMMLRQKLERSDQKINQITTLAVKKENKNSKKNKI
jgi:hypothetical protein